MTNIITDLSIHTVSASIEAVLFDFSGTLLADSYVHHGLANLADLLDERWDIDRQTASSGFVANFARLFLRIRITGREHIPLRGPLIVACNHISFWDPPLVGSLFPRVLAFLAKEELFQNKLFGALIAGYNSIPIPRGPRARSALRGAEGVLDRGGAVLIFPEGTRSKTGSFLPPRAGISHLAAVSQAPVLPARIKGSRQIRRSMLRRVEIRIAFGSMMMPPVGPPGRREDGHAYARRVMDEIAALSVD